MAQATAEADGQLVDIISPLSDGSPENDGVILEKSSDPGDKMPSPQEQANETEIPQITASPHSLQIHHTLDSATAVASSEKPELKVRWKHVFFVCLGISVCAVPVGWDIGTTGSLVDLPSFRAIYTIPSGLIGLFVSVFNAGCAAGSICIGRINHRRYGYIRTLQGCWAVYFIGVVVQLCAGFLRRRGLWMLASGRLVCGCAAGAMNAFGPTFIHQLVLVLPGRNEGFLAVFGCSTCGTILIGNLVFMAMGHGSGEVDEKMACFGVQAGLCGVAGLISLFLPDTPGFYLASGQQQRFKPVLQKMLSGADDEVAFAATLQSLQVGESQGGESGDNGEDNGEDGGANGDRGANRGANGATARCCMLAVFQQLIGINFFLYYGKPLFAGVLTPRVHNLPMVVMSTLNATGSVCAGYIFRRWRGKNVLMVGLGILLALLAIFTPLGASPSRTTVAAVVMFVSVCGFILVFSCTWGGGVGIMNQTWACGDASIVSIAVLTGWVINTVVLLVTPIAVDRIGINVSYIFMCGCAILGILVWVS